MSIFDTLRAAIRDQEPIALVTIVGVYAVSGRVQESGQVTVRSVSAKSPAETSGLLPGDVVRTIDGRAVHTEDEFRHTLAAAKPGIVVVLLVLLLVVLVVL